MIVPPILKTPTKSKGEKIKVQQTLNPENIVEITEEDSGHRPQQTQIEKNTLTITMLDVGQGLCVLFESDDQYLLFDGADRDYASYVVSYLQQHGIGLDYLTYSNPSRSGILDVHIAHCPL